MARRLISIGANMKTENVVHHYINAYVNQVERIKENRQVTELTKYQNAKEYREQEYRAYQYMAMIVMMQFLANNQMWNILNQIRIQRTLDITA